MSSDQFKEFKVSVIVPIYNEEGNISPLLDRLVPVLQQYHDYEILFVDDGSRDHTLETIKSSKESNSHIHYISFARNFGHQNALKAGLDHVTGDCVITMDGDLQHPPELIPQFIEKWLEGYDVVYTIRREDTRLSFLKRLTSRFFYRLMNRLSGIHIPEGAADFRLLDRKVADVLKDIREYHLFYRGLTPWLGFHQIGITYLPEERFSGQTKYSIRKMIAFALTGITSFSLKPLRISVLFGVFFALLAFIYGGYALYMKFFTDSTVPGWASVLISVLFIGGIQLIVLGIIGEYIGKLFMESKHRPHYIIKEKNVAIPPRFETQEKQEPLK